MFSANFCLIVLYLRSAEPAAMWDGSRWERVKRKLLKTVMPSCHLTKRGKILKLFEKTFVASTLG